TVAFKGVLLEGLEVVFIVLTFGAAQGRIWLAAIAAAAALVGVVAAGFFVRAPLERVPENRVKFAVVPLLSSFGGFLSARGAGFDGPGSDLGILGILAFRGASSALYVHGLRGRRVPAVSEAGA